MHNTVPFNAAFHNVRTGNVSNLRYFNNITDFNHTDNGFFNIGTEQSFHCLFNFFNRFVNDIILADIYFLLLGKQLCLRGRTHIKADNNRIRISGGKHNIGIIDSTGRCMDNIQPYFCC